MKKTYLLLLTLILISLLGCQEIKVEKIKINLNAKSNSKTSGEVSLTERNGVVTLEANIYG